MTTILARFQWDYAFPKRAKAYYSDQLDWNNTVVALINRSHVMVLEKLWEERKSKERLTLAFGDNLKFAKELTFFLHLKEIFNVVFEDNIKNKIVIRTEDKEYRCIIDIINYKEKEDEKEVD